jgi:hypothetical protein
MANQARQQYLDDLRKKLLHASIHNTDHPKDHAQFLRPPENDELQARLLKPLDEDLLATNGMPFLKYDNHAFIAANGKWYIATCPGMVPLACPVCEANQKAAKDVAGRRRVKTQYIVNACQRILHQLPSAPARREQGVVSEIRPASP